MQETSLSRQAIKKLLLQEGRDLTDTLGRQFSNPLYKPHAGWSMSEEQKQKLSEIQTNPDFIAKHHKAKSEAQKRLNESRDTTPFNTSQAIEKRVKTFMSKPLEERKARGQKGIQTRIKNTGTASVISEESIRKRKETLANMTEEEKADLKLKLSKSAKALMNTQYGIQVRKRNSINYRANVLAERGKLAGFCDPDMRKEYVRRSRRSTLEKKVEEFFKVRKIDFETEYFIQTEEYSHHYGFAIFKEQKLTLLVDCDSVY